VGQPQPSPDLREDVLHPFPVPQLVEDDDLVFPELIAVRLSCHSRFSFLDECASGLPRNEKSPADHSGPTRPVHGLWRLLRPPASSLYMVNLTSFHDGFWYLWEWKFQVLAQGCLCFLRLLGRQRYAVGCYGQQEFWSLDCNGGRWRSATFGYVAVCLPGRQTWIGSRSFLGCVFPIDAQAQITYPPSHWKRVLSPTSILRSHIRNSRSRSTFRSALIRKERNHWKVRSFFRGLQRSHRLL